MLKPFLMVPVLFLFGAPAFFQQTSSAPANATQDNPAQASPAAPAESKIPAEYVSMVNPVKPTPESQKRAQQIYGWDCAMCHNANGDGKGDVAADQNLSMKDYRDPAALKSLSDGEIFYIIRNGEGKMPGEGERAKTDEVWNLVIYLRKMASQPATASAQPPA